MFLVSHNDIDYTSSGVITVVGKKSPALPGLFHKFANNYDAQV
jgi:hypothetical protein